MDRGGPARSTVGDAPSSPGPAPAGAPGEPPTLTPDQQAEAEAMAAEMASVREQLASVPAAVVVANHAMGLYELAAIHLSQQPPNAPEARVAIDAFAALVETLKGRLGDDEPVLVDALAQLRLAFVQVTAAGAEQAPAEGSVPS